VTWDYRCPFARNAHEHLVAGLQAGAQWDVTFLSFSLDQAHVEEGGTSVFDEPQRYPGLLGNLVGIVVRDRYPEKFLSAHQALFEARHDQALDTRERDVLGKVLVDQGLDASAVLGEIDAGWPLQTFRAEHEASVNDHQVFGVPTFIAGDQSVFVRLMSRPKGDAAFATSTIERVMDLVGGWADLNEFKHTSIPR
jgi:predicted DsbA family dithiol-disulfide isomerase